MNMQSLMAQAQKMQKDLKIATDELESTVFTGENAVVRIELNGKYEVTKVNILDDSVLEDKEMLEDMLLLAMNDALKTVSKTKEEKLGKLTGGMGGLF